MQNQKGFTHVALLLIIIFFAIAVISYFLVQRNTVPSVEDLPSVVITQPKNTEAEKVVDISSDENPFEDKENPFEYIE